MGGLRQLSPISTEQKSTLIIIQQCIIPKPGKAGYNGIRLQARLSTLENMHLPWRRSSCKAVGPVYFGRAIPRHVKDPRASVDKIRVLNRTSLTPQQWRCTVSLHRHDFCSLCVGM